MTTVPSNDIENVRRLRNERIQWKKEDKTFADLHTQIKEGRFNLDPEHQRDVVHNDKWKSEVLHSQIFHGDIPDVYFHPTTLADGTRKYDSLDGKQRCSAIYEYLGDAFKYKLREPSDMYNKKFSELTPAFKTFLKDDCCITARMAIRSLTNEEIQTFFQKRQNFKKTSCGEHLNSCLTSSINQYVKNYIETPLNMERLEKAGFHKNDRQQYTETVSYILRIFKHHDESKNNIDCSPTKLKIWYTSVNPLGEHREHRQAAFKLVDYTLDILSHIHVKGGNTSKNAYISCAWYVMNHCFANGNFIIDSIETLKIKNNGREFILPPVGGNHSGYEQRLEFKKLIEK